MNAPSDEDLERMIRDFRSTGMASLSRYADDLTRLLNERRAWRAALHSCFSGLSGFLGAGQLDVARAEELYQMLLKLGGGPNL